MSGFRFHDPLWLLSIPVLLFLLVWNHRRRNAHSIIYSSASLVRNLPRSLKQRVRSLLPWAAGLGFVLVAAALARPQLGSEEFRIRREGIAIQIALDRSGSMAAQDFTLGNQRVNRLEAARSVVHDFVEGDGKDLPGRGDDRVGLIAFGGFAESLTPLTLDHVALLQILQQVQLPPLGGPLRDTRGNVINREIQEEEGATAIGDAIAIAVERLRQKVNESRVLILLSDGKNTAGILDPMDAARTAAQIGVKVYCIGIGSTGMAPFPTIGLGGRTRLQQRYVELDEITLKEIAKITGGRYFNAKNTTGLREVYAEIDQLERTQTEDTVYTHYFERFHWFLLPGMALLALAYLLQSTWLRTIP